MGDDISELDLSLEAGRESTFFDRQKKVENVRSVKKPSYMLNMSCAIV